MSNLVFLPDAWAEYLYWQQQDKKTLRKINVLIQEVTRHPFTGTGKPEPLKGELTGWWSRRIDEVHRLVYRVADGGNIEIAQCRGHYDD
jgi:toxin YoeB